jgi:hypothetical protein
VTDAAANPPVIPVLKFRSGVRSASYVDNSVHDPFIVPARRKLGLAGLSDSVPMTAAVTDEIAVENVRGPLRAHADLLNGRPVRGIHRIPARTIRPRVASLRRLTVRHAERLVIFLVTTPLSRIRPYGRNVTTRKLWPGEIVIRPV